MTTPTLTPFNQDEQKTLLAVINYIPAPAAEDGWFTAKELAVTASREIGKRISASAAFNRLQAAWQRGEVERREHGRFVYWRTARPAGKQV